MLWPWQSKNSWGAPQGSPSFSFIQVDMISPLSRSLKPHQSRIKRGLVGLSGGRSHNTGEDGAVGGSVSHVLAGQLPGERGPFPSSAPPR